MTADSGMGYIVSAVSASKERADTERSCIAEIRFGCGKVKSNKATVKLYIITAEQLHLLCCVIYDFIYSFKDTYSGILKSVNIDGGEEGIRTLVGLPPNGFQDRLVMTTSIPLRIVL